MFTSFISALIREKYMDCLTNVLTCRLLLHDRELPRSMTPARLYQNKFPSHLKLTWSKCNKEFNAIMIEFGKKTNYLNFLLCYLLQLGKTFP